MEIGRITEKLRIVQTSHRTRSRKGKLIFEVLAVILSLVVIIPSYMIIINSFKDKAGASQLNINLPEKWSLIENYKTVFVKANIPQAFSNTLSITMISVISLVLLCSISAFVIQRRNDRFCKVLPYFFIAGMILPLSIIPTYIMLHTLHLTGNYWGLIILYIATSYPFVTYIYTGFFDGISREIDEAAIIDGAQGLKLFYSVIFPLLKPINATAIIICFVGIWNEFNMAIYFLSSPKLYSLSITIYFFFGQHTTDWNFIFADIVIISIPVIIVYILLQKYIISGLTSGAVKS